jgi:hypothetical protein
MQDKKKWCIGYVNYNSDVYLKWQLKILYEFNNPDDFELIIVDNSSPNQTEELEILVKPYNDLNNNIKIVFHNPKSKKASDQHAEGLDIIKDMMNAKYLLVQDPDFFYVKENYLRIFESHLENGVVAIGAPYPSLVGNGNPRFPCAFGCAMVANIFDDVNINFQADASRFEESIRDFPGFDFSFDVGYKIRLAYSDRRVISFEQKRCGYLSKIIGSHSFEVISQEYFLEGETIAFHLFRGTFTGEVNADHEDPKLVIKKETIKIRNNYGKFFYDYIRKSTLSYKTYLKIKFFVPSVMFFLDRRRKSFKKSLRKRFVFRFLK